MLSAADAEVVGRDSDLPDLALLLDPERLSARIARTVGHSRVTDVTVGYLRYKPGQSCVAACRAEVDGQLIDFTAKTWRAHAAAKIWEATSSADVQGPLGPGRFVLADSAVLVSVFPNDSRLDRLAQLMLPHSLEELTERIACRTAAPVTLETLRYNPERRFVGRLLVGGTPHASVRCYGPDDYLGVIAKVGALRSRGPLKLARRLGRMQRFRLLAFEWLDGALLDEALDQQTVTPQAMQLVGRALADLHGQTAPALPRRTGVAEALAVAASAEHVARLHPPLAHLARGLARRIAPRLAGEERRPQPIHGDFYARQVVLQPWAAALLDLDEASLGDPAIDLARFRADLEARAVAGALGAAAVDTIFESLLSGYRRTACSPMGLDLHVAAQLVRLSVHPFRRREPAWPDRATALLERAHDRLDDAPTGRGGRVARSTPSSRPSPRTDAGRSGMTRDVGPDRRAGPLAIDPFGILDDPAMPFLRLVLDPAEMAARFASALHRPESDTQVEVTAITVERYKPGRRCLVAYDVVTRERGRLRLMGKVRARGADTSTHTLQHRLWSLTFGARADDGISVPEPLGWISDVHMTVQRRVEGERLGRMLEGPAGRVLARRAAEAIHKLHRSGVPARRSHSVDDEVDILRQRLTNTTVTHPEWRDRIEDLLAGCAELAERVREGSSCCVHRDFHPDQLLVSDTRLYITDLDLYSEGPPALDVGNFAAHVDEYSLRRFGTVAALAGMHDAVVDRYLELSPSTTREAIRIWTTLALARLVDISTRVAERRPFSSRLLSLCECRVRDDLAGRASAATTGARHEGATP